MKFLRRYSKGPFVVTEFQAPNGDLVTTTTYTPPPTKEAPEATQ